MNSDAMAFLAQKGMTLDEIIEFARISERKTDSTNADRQARYRAKRRAAKQDDDVTRYGNGVTPPPNDIYSNPPPASEEPSGSPEVARRRKADPFPCPDGVDQTDWEALKSNRKAKRAPLTEGAHRQIIKKLDQWGRDGWPPGPIVAHAAELGWTSVFETDEMKAPRNGQSRKPNGRPGNSGPDPILDALARATAEARELERSPADQAGRAGIGYALPAQ